MSLLDKLNNLPIVQKIVNIPWIKKVFGNKYAKWAFIIFLVFELAKSTLWILFFITVYFGWAHR